MYILIKKGEQPEVFTKKQKTLWFDKVEDALWFIYDNLDTTWYPVYVDAIVTKF